MLLASEMRRRVWGTDGSRSPQQPKDGSAPSGDAASPPPNKRPPLRHAFYGSVSSEDPATQQQGSNASFFGPNAKVDEGVATFTPRPPLALRPQLEQYDKLALILHASLERRKNRRRIHEYPDTFYGKHAVDWLVGTHTFQDVSDARNAMRHLLNRRLIKRADHTKPLLNNALERVAPKMAASRRQDLINRYASPNRGFHDEQLYRFPPEAYSKIQLNVRVVRARNLRFKSRLHVGSFMISSKFREQRVEPYCLLEFGYLTAKTDTWSDGGSNPAWEAEFSFPIESNPHSTDLATKDLWIRVLDFHEISDDVELGFCLVPREEIMAKCAQEEQWTAWHTLKSASELGPHDKTSGEVELVISLSPFIARNPLWTVHKEARSREPAASDFDTEPEDSENFVTAAFGRVGDVVNHVGDHVNKIVDKAKDLGGSHQDLGGDSGLHQDDADRRFKLHIYKCALAPNLADARKDSSVWIEYLIHLNNHNNSSSGTSYRGRSEAMTWPVKEFGQTYIRGLTLDDIQNAAQIPVVVKVFARFAGITVKLGDASIPLKKFIPDLEAEVVSKNDGEVDWKSYAKMEKLVLRRTAAFRRNRRRIVGEAGIKALLEPDDDASSEDDNESNFGGDDSPEEAQANMVVEDELTTVASMLSDNFTTPEPLGHFILKENFKDVPMGTLFWFVLSRNSPLLAAYSAKKNFSKLVQGEWRWGGRDRRGSFIEDTSPEDTMLVLADSSKGGVLVNRAVVSEPAPESPSPSPTTPSNANSGTPKFHSESMARKDTAPFIKQDSLSRLVQLGEGKSLPSLPSQTESGDPSGEEESEIKDTDSPKSGLTLRSNTATAESMHKGLKPDDGDFPNRVITYIRPPELGVGELEVKEIWRLKAFSADKGFWLEVEGTTNEPMYGKQMAVVVQIVVLVEPNHSSSMTISSTIKWNPRPFSAGIVERTALPGTTKGYMLYANTLKSLLRKKSKGSKGGEKDEEEAVEEAEEESKARSRKAVVLAVLRIVALLVLAALLVVVIYYIFVIRPQEEEDWMKTVLEKVKEKAQGALNGNSENSEL